jgi:hypothetical protein
MPARDHFRAHARRRVDLDAILRGQNVAFSHTATIRDLGLGGASLELADNASAIADISATARGEARAPLIGVEREALVVLEVIAPSLWDPLAIAGKIAWLRRGLQGRPWRAGVRFDHREPAALNALFQLLGAHMYDG